MGEQVGGEANAAMASCSTDHERTIRIPYNTNSSERQRRIFSRLFTVGLLCRWLCGSAILVVGIMRCIT
jgi:hypothetical protein